MCCREGPESPEFPLREPPGCLPRVVLGEIGVLPSDGRGMALIAPNANKARGIVRAAAYIANSNDASVGTDSAGRRFLLTDLTDDPLETNSYRRCK